MTIAKAQQLCTEIQVGVTQEEEEEPEEMGWCLTRKHMLVIIQFNSYLCYQSLLLSHV